MIVVTIELVSARTKKTSLLGRMFIANDGSGTASRGNYDVVALKRGKALIKTQADIHRRGRVENYPRKSYTMWRLITRALKSAFPEEA